VTVNLTKIYTRLGDDGETHLGDMSRVPKVDARIEAYGTVDELNAQIGVAVTTAGGGNSSAAGGGEVREIFMFGGQTMDGDVDTGEVLAFIDRYLHKYIGG
jgi:cob(I)alamin adenosyltransferase